MTLERAGAFLAGAFMSLVVLVLAAMLGDDSDDDEGAWTPTASWSPKASAGSGDRLG